MSIARISGTMLQANLERQGTNLSIDAAAYFDVSNYRLGVNNSSPQYTLDVTGNAHLGNLYILGNTIQLDSGYKLNLGAISNITIAGGAANTVVYTDGAGNLSFGNLAQLSGIEGFSGNSITLGANTRGTLAPGATSLSSTTTVTDAIALLNQSLGNITGGGGGAISTSGNINAGNANIAGNLTTGNITVNFNANVLGNIAVQNFISGKIKSGTVSIPTSANIIYVATNGNDTSNDGTINSPYASIAKAANSAPSGASIHVAPGVYTENNPVTIPNNVSLIGDTIRAVSVQPQNPNSDIFYLSGGTYVWGLTVKNYNANAFAYSPSMSNMNFYVSPYIQNITSSATNANACAVMIDGNYVGPLGTKAMIVGFYTMIN
jgi:hypothetical protein